MIRLRFFVVVVAFLPSPQFGGIDIFTILDLVVQENNMFFPLFKILFYVIYWLLSWRRGPLPTPVFWPGKSQGLYRRAFCIGFIRFGGFLFWFACFDSIVNGVVFLILNCLLLSSVTNNQAPSARDVFSFPGLGWLPREGNGNPLQYPSWEIPWTEDPAGLQSLGS